LYFSFVVMVEDRSKKVTKVRVNAYGTLAGICSGRISKGSYVVVTGNLMNKPRSEAVEIRCDEIIFLSGGRDEQAREWSEDGEREWNR
jgi:hypothetical protein